jgi:type VI secretion system protein ImpA
MNLESLLAPRSDDAPSGENLEYDSNFIEMEIAAQPGEEKQAGNEILAAEEPDFADVATKAMAVMEQSHDLRAGVIYAWAILNTKGLIGFVDATAYVRGCLEQYWDTCHPQLDADDDNDPTMRINAVKGLAATDGVLRSLKRARLSRSRTFGELNVRDLQVAHGEAQPLAGVTATDKSTAKAAFENTDPEWAMNTLSAAKASLANLKAIDAIFSRQTPGYGPDLDETTKTLQAAVRLMSEYVRAPQAEAAVADEEEEGADMPDDVPRPRSAPAGRAASAPGTIANRDDVVAALDGITAYYRDFEPSSPVPIILARARRLVNADFMEIIKDLAPSGVDNVNIIGGL